MVLELWNYLRGYVVVEASGSSVERFINLVARRGIYIWDVFRTGSGVTMKVSVKGFKLMRACAKKSKCKIKIKSKRGYPFVAHRYRKRKILAGGIIFFVFILYALSAFVWLIDIKGNDIISRDEIIEFCAGEGLRQGSPKFGLSAKALENKLLEHFPSISWVNVHIKGTRAQIDMTEIIPKKQILDNSIPCDIVAKKDGLIVSIATSTGTPKVRQLDVVKKGDLLVSGELVVKNDETGIVKEYVHAAAEVLAKMYYEINVSVSYECVDKQYTDNIKKKNRLIILDKNIDINLINTGIPFTNYDRITILYQLKMGEDYPLPIILARDDYKEFIPVDKVRTPEQAKELGERMVTGRIIREFDFEADIVDISYEYHEKDDGVDVKAVVTTVERIGEKREITNGERETNN